MSELNFFTFCFNSQSGSYHHIQIMIQIKDVQRNEEKWKENRKRST